MHPTGKTKQMTEKGKGGECDIGRVQGKIASEEQMPDAKSRYRSIKQEFKILYTIIINRFMHLLCPKSSS